MKYEVISKKLASGEAPIELIHEDQRVAMTAAIKYASDYGDEYLLGMAFAPMSEATQAQLKAVLTAVGGPGAVELEDIPDD